MANLIDKTTIEKEFFESQFISQKNKNSDVKLFLDVSEASSYINKQKQTAQYRIIKKDILNEQNVSDSIKNEKIVSYKTLNLNNATKITGKLVAFRKDGLSYTLKPITTTSSQNFVTTKTLTCSFPDQKALKNSPQLNDTLNGKKSDESRSTIVNNSQKLICKTLNTSSENKGVIKSSEIKLFTPKDNSNQNQTTLIKQTNSIKPIILHMKRKIQVPKNENYKTAKIFTLPSNKLIGNNKIISNQNQISSQFIIMDKQSSLKTLNCFSNKDNKIFLNKKNFVPVTSSTNTGTILKSVKSFTSLNTKLTDQESIHKLPVKSEKNLSLLIPTKQSETLVSKNFISYAENDESLKNNNSSDSELNNFSENNKLKINENYNFETELNYDKKNSLNENQKLYSVENSVFTSNNEQMSIEHNNDIFDENQNFYSDCGSQCEIKNEINTFSDDKKKENSRNGEKYFDNKNYSETYELTKSDTPLILNENSSTLQNMQTEIKTDLFNNLIMDECAAAMVLMSLSYSPKNSSSLLQNHASTSSSLISQKVVFQCTWRNCGKESEDRQEIKQHIRQEHLKVRKPRGNHEEDFYYTEIDVFDSNTQDSSGISSAADSPQQSIASCCGELVECCNCNEVEFEDKKIDTKTNKNELSKKYLIKNLFNFKKEKIKDCKISCINKKQIQRKIIDKNRKVKKSSNLWSKKNFEVKHNRVGRPKRIKINSQFLSVKKNIEKEKNILDCGKLEWSVRKNASSPINIPGISLAHHQTKNNKNFDYKKINENLDLIDVNYNSDQFNVGSVRSSCVELLEQCMGKHERENSFNERKSSYSSSNSSGLPASLNSFGTSIYSTNSSTSSSPPLHSDYSTTDQDFNEEWLFDKNSKQKIADDVELETFETKNICKNLDLPDKNSIKKCPNIIKLRLPSEQENSKPYLVRNSRQNVNSNQQTNKTNQKTNGYYADLHRGLIQPPNLHHFSNSDFFNNSLQSSNHQIDKTTSNPSSSKNIQVKTTTQIARRSRNGSGNGGKCRKKYGMENRDQWCVQCRWKKACSRVEPSFSIDDNEFSSNSTLLNGVVQSYIKSEQVTLH